MSTRGLGILSLSETLHPWEEKPRRDITFLVKTPVNVKNGEPACVYYVCTRSTDKQVQKCIRTDLELGRAACSRTDRTVVVRVYD